MTSPSSRLRKAVLIRSLLVIVKLLERFLVVKPGDPLFARLEIQPQGPLDADFAIAEVGGVEDLRDLGLAALAIQQVGIDAHDLVRGASSGISRRLEPSDLRIDFQNRSPEASISCTLPRRLAGLRLVSSQT